MEDQIKAAENAKSISGEICRWAGALAGISLGLAIFWSEAKKNEFNTFSWWKPVSALLGGFALSAHGSNTTNIKRTNELTSLLVKSTNSASLLPIRKTSEYSDLLEDSDNE